MTTSGDPGAERYPGETLALLRAIHGQLAELLVLRQQFGPLLDSLSQGRGLLGAARAARRQNGAPADDYPTADPGAPGAGIGPGIWGRAHRARNPGPGPGAGEQ